MPGANVEATITAAEQAARDELSAYTLMRGDADFIHQHVVDAFAAQHVTAQSKPIGVAFALIGLYLHLERGYSAGRSRRRTRRLARRQKRWPAFVPPANAGELTVVEVMRSPPGAARDQAIEAWCESVWSAWHDSHAQVAALVSQLGEGDSAGQSR